MAIYGIDLGTTYCAVAYVLNGQARVLPLENGGKTLASVVLYDRLQSASARAVVGKYANECFRRLVGNADVAPPELVLVRGAKNFMSVRTRVPGGPPWKVGQQELWSTDVSATILSALAEYVRTTPGCPPMDGVVIAHPQRFRTREKLATAQAAAMAGLEVIGMVTEPDAAAWAYGLHDRADNHASPVATFMVFDFGGGTLDVTIMKRAISTEGKSQIRAIDSYGVQLGGLAIDEKIRDRLLEKYCALSGVDGVQLDNVNEETREDLLSIAEELKIELNQDLSAEVAPWERARRKWIGIAASDAIGEKVQVEVKLGELSAWIAGDIDRAIACADEALLRAKMQWKDIDRVLLTGGSSQLYAMQVRMKERAAGRVQIVFDQADHPLNPQTIVATGAALYGTALRHGMQSGALMIQGVLPDSFSVKAQIADPREPTGKRTTHHTLIAAGTPTPFVGRANFQISETGRRLAVEVFEGREVAEATSVGTYTFDFDYVLNKGTPVEVELDVAANGALLLRVADRATGVKRESVLNAAGLYSDREFGERREWLRGIRVEIQR
jgi:molecular chaperone DnaK (HSP70)